MGMIVSLLRRLLLSKGGAVMLGLLIAAALVWYAGPRLGLTSVLVRVVIIASLFAVAGLYILLRWLIARSRGARFQKELSSQQDGDDGRQAELESLKQKMDEAVASLKASGLGVKYRGTAALYALPWYMIIGPSAAGKSTLLRNSGLHFPYAHADDIDIRGFGGTRNCDWWFSEEAVFLDTAGRYTTEENDHEEWVTFLGLLRKYRRRMPINGIVVAVSLSDLLTGDDDDIEWHVKVIRERINELVGTLGYLFPTYIVFTKCDLLKGFESYFGDMGEGEREQVWGLQLDGRLGEGNIEEAVGAKLGQLYEKLSELRLRKLSMQRKHHLKSEIFDFPAQFMASSERLIEFLSLLFRENPYQEQPRFSGVYFTSGTQEGLPLQRVVGNLRHAFGYVEQAPEQSEQRKEKSYFIHDFLKKVILAAPTEALMSRRRKIVTRWLKGATVTAAAAVVIAALIGFSASYTTNSLILSEGQEATAALTNAVKSQDSDPTTYYAALSRLYAHYETLKGYERNPPWYMHLGVYQGGKEIAPVEHVLVQAMRREFLGDVGHTLEDKLKRYSNDWKAVKDEQDYAKIRGRYYSALKAYLMLSKPKYIEKKQAVALLYPQWSASVFVANLAKDDPDSAKITAKHLKGLVGLYLDDMRRPKKDGLHARNWKLADAIVEKARSQLRTPPNAELLYAQLKNKGRLLLKSVSLKGLVKGRGVSYFKGEATIPVLYTKRGWEKFASREIESTVLSASRGDWVLGTYQKDTSAQGGDTGEANTVDRSLSKRLRKAMRALYFNDYEDVWFHFLRRIQVARFDTTDDAADRLVLMARNDGPIASVLKAVDDNIVLRNVSWDVKGGKIAKHGKVTAVPVKELDSAFSDLRRFTKPGEKGKVSELVAQYLIALGSLQGEVDRMRASSDTLNDAEAYAAGIFNGSGRNTELYKTWVTTTGLLNGTDLRTKRAIEPLFISPIRQTWRTILASAVRAVQKRWASVVLHDYDSGIRGRFPFSRTGADAALDDVAEFFRPKDGTLWSFVNSDLTSFLRKSRRTWRPRKWLGVRPEFSHSFIAALNRAQLVTDALFKRGRDTPGVTFYLYPIPESGLSQTLLESNGQIYRYRNEPQEWRRFKWPGTKGPAGARVVGVSAKANIRAEVSAQGVWGLFHILQKADVKKEPGAQYLSVWKISAANGNPIRVSFKFKADRRNNVFVPGLLRGLRLPASIMQASLRRDQVAVR